ncbi:MAG TPA: cupin-like domain-containing protein [Allosphingosinicella sp.]|nr:cupin-like domain-containing protein [Allosphingosinicella sp.]
MRTHGTIERIAAADTAAIADRVARGRPAIVDGGAAGWKIRRAWTSGRLRARLGHVPIAWRQARSEIHPTISADDAAVLSRDCTGTLAGYLDRMAETPTVFLDANLVALASRSQPANPDLAPMLADLETPPWVERRAIDTIGVWLSGKGVRTRLHYDRNGRDNYNAQLAGRKLVVLVPPDRLPLLDPFPLGSAVHNFSRVDVYAPDFADARALGALGGELKPGDLLYLPAFWFHAFEHRGAFNFNVNFWCDPICIPLNPTSLRQEAAGLLARALEAEEDEPATRRRLVARIEAACLDWTPARPPGA